MEELEKKFAEQIKTANSDMEEKMAALEAKVSEGAKPETIKELQDLIDTQKSEIEKMQDQYNIMQTQIKKAEVTEVKTANPTESMQLMIKENFDDIKTVRKGKSVNMQLKTVGNMILSNNLTGDQPRDYSSQVAVVPGQMVNFSDLIGSVMISGGTYTFPRESGSEGAIATQTEGSDKSQIDYDITMVDVNTDFIAGFCVYSKKMANNLPFLESFLPGALRRDYAIQENSTFYTALAAAATASSAIITGANKVEMLIADIAALEGTNFYPNAIVVTPADYYDILITEKSTGAGYGLPGVVTLVNGQLAINGIPVIRANWMATNKYFVGDWSTVKKVITEGLSLDFSESDEDNFRKNNITARVEAQVGLAIHRTDAVLLGDFTST